MASGDDELDDDDFLFMAAALLLDNMVLLLARDDADATDAAQLIPEAEVTAVADDEGMY